MGLMRRAGSSAESAVSGPSTLATVERSAGWSMRKSSPRIHPKELAQKLVKELENRKISRVGRVSVCNRFTVYLCPDDYDHFSGRMDGLTVKLERDLAKHVRAKKYEAVGDLKVCFTRELDLRPGFFGILAESSTLAAASRLAQPSGLQAGEDGGGKFPAGFDNAPPAVIHQMPAGATTVISSSQAAQLSLASHTIVLSCGDRVREFSKSRVILGRARDTDFRINDPNVSRHHAAVYWDEGRVNVKDLDSTNGTMVNGYPITDAVLRTKDVLYLGDSRIVVEIKSG